MHVLLHSPSSPIQNLLRDVCENEGYELTTYPLIDDLAAAALHEGDLALLDLSDAPHDPGRELDLQRLARHPHRHPDRPFSGLPRSRAARLGIAEVIRTPLEASCLVSALSAQREALSQPHRRT